ILKETNIMEDLNSKGAAKDMLLTGKTRIQTCETQVGTGYSPVLQKLAPAKHSSKGK
ncbi:hypothetical protein HAX54_047242, partial [Datura stramonium]|nr:hypothetical protein [Datura stramonium]